MVRILSYLLTRARLVRYAPIAWLLRTFPTYPKSEGGSTLILLFLPSSIMLSHFESTSTSSEHTVCVCIPPGLSASALDHTKLGRPVIGLRRGGSLFNAGQPCMPRRTSCVRSMMDFGKSLRLSQRRRSSSRKHDSFPMHVGSAERRKQLSKQRRRRPVSFPNESGNVIKAVHHAKSSLANPSRSPTDSGS